MDSETEIFIQQILKKMSVLSVREVPFTQSVASSTWSIPHGLNGHPNVVAFDGSGNELVGDVSYPTLSQVILTFSQAVSGTAYLR